MFADILVKLYKAKGAVAFTVLVVIGFALSAISPFLNGVFVDFLISNTDIKSIITFAIFIAAVGIISTVLAYQANMATIKVTTNTAFLVLRDLVDKYLHAELINIEKMSSSYTTQRIFSDVNVVTKFVIGSFLSIPLTCFVCVFVYILFLSVNAFIAFLAFGLTSLYVVLFVKMKKPLYEASLAKKEADSIYFGEVESGIAQAYDVQLRSAYEESQRSLNGSFLGYIPTVIRTSRVNFLFSSADGFIAAVFQSVVLVVAGVQIIIGNMTVGEFTMINSYFSLLLNSMKSLISFFQQFQDAKASYGRIEEMSGYESRRKGSPIKPPLRSVSLSGLSFSIPEDSSGIERELFNNLEFVFEPQTVYAVVGDNGCGKSTLLKLLMGLYDPGDSVLFNGIPASKVDLYSLRRESISVVPQKLFSPRSTVGLFLSKRMGIPEKELAAFLESADNALAGYSKQLLLLLGKKCSDLSGGELRKLHLFVAVNQHSDVIILDEPSTGLDESGKTELISFMRQNVKGQIMIIMTHDKRIIDASQVQLELSVDCA